MSTILHDLRYGLRVLARSPGFAAAAILSLALGIGASAAIFTVVYGVLLKPLPFPEPDRIVHVWQVGPTGNEMRTSDPTFEDLRDRNRSFQALAQYSGGTVSVTGGAEAARVRLSVVSSDFFRALGAVPFLGRTFTEEEDRPGGRLAVVVSHAFWRRALGSDPTLQGRTLSFEGHSFDVVGVMPPWMTFPEGTDLWAPRHLWPRYPSRTAHNWRMVGRLEDGVTLAQARSDVSAIGRDLKARFGKDIWLSDVGLVPLHEELVGDVRPALLVLIGAVGILLLVACANVANLTLAHLTARGRELAVRAALGAGAGRLNRQLLTESALLASAGGALGFLLAPWAVNVLLLMDPGRLPRVEEVQVNFQVALFTLAVSAAVTAALALAAGTRHGRTDASETLRGAGRSQASSRGEERIRAVLVSAQVALALVLLVSAGLLGRTLARVLSQDPGFRTSGAVTVDLAVSGAEDPAEWAATAAFYERVMARLRSEPAVTAVGGISGLPLTGSYADGTFILQRPGESFMKPDGQPDFALFERLAKDTSRTGQAEFRVASEGYFAAMAIPVLRGRTFDDGDRPEGAHVAVISESLARRVWKDRDPLGALVQFGNMDGDVRPFTIVGVVGDIRDRALEMEPRPTLYALYRQRPRVISNFSIVAATSGDPGALAGAAERIVRRVRPDVPPRVRLIEDVVAASIADRRFNAWLLGGFGFSAIALAALGLYGVTSFWVSRRTQEIGIRLTMGATPGEVVRMVAGRTGRLVGAGAAAGLAGALAVSRALGSMLFGVAPTDAATFVGATALLSFVALVACVVPAVRAARVDPAVALRQE